MLILHYFPSWIWDINGGKKTQQEKEWKYSKIIIFFSATSLQLAIFNNVLPRKEQNTSRDGSGLIEYVFYCTLASYIDWNKTDFSLSLQSPLYQFHLKPDRWGFFGSKKHFCAFHGLPLLLLTISISVFHYTKVYRCLILPNVNTVLLTRLTSLLHLNQPCWLASFSKLKRKKKRQGRLLQASFWGCLQLCSLQNTNKGNFYILTSPAIHVSV